MKKLNKKIKEVIEKQGWTIHEDEEWVELEKSSPAGEDFVFSINKNEFLTEVINYAEYFDADEHAEMWVQNMHTVSGVPQSIRTLIEDADAIKEMLLELARSLENLK